jgi:2-amino-4-hydroxy-6-hydroxymethyldihydropteridine diphosphokinase
MNTVFLSLGGNTGNRKENLEKAVKLLGQMAGDVTAVSQLYETAPWGMQSHLQFLNMAVKLQTTLQPAQLMEKLLSIEQAFGRTRRTDVYMDRSVDIDIILFGNLVINEASLTVPHPRMAQRRFVLLPLCEIAAEVEHPVLKKTTAQLLNGCPDNTAVSLWKSTESPI